jgi:hypothetical protein
MAINYYANIGMIGSDIEMNQNELQLPVIDNEGTAPSTPVEGQMYFDTTAGDKVMYFWNGTAWTSMDASAATGVTTFTNANGTFIDAATVNTNATGAVTTGVIDLSATGTPGGTTFLRGDNVWATPSGSYTSWSLEGDTGTAVDITDGLRVDFTGGDGISTAVSTATPNKLLISNTGVLSIVAGTNISVSAATGDVTVSSTDTNTTLLGIANINGAEQFTVNDTASGRLRFAATGGASVSFDSTNKVVSYAAPSNTNETYTLPVSAGTALAGYSVADIDLTAGGTGSGIKSKVTLAGENDNIEITETTGNNGFVKIGLPDDVTISGLLTSGTVSTGAITGGIATLTGASLSGVIDMNSNQINELADGTLSGDAVNYGQLLSATSGNSEFQGGYNADTNTPDLDSNPSTSIQQGYFWAVTDSGTFFAETVQPGDLIFANQDNPGATFSNWTVVQSGQETAGEGASDGATTKGIAGFDSATFGVTANGFVTSDIYGGASTLGVVPSGGGATTFLRGDGTWVVPTNSNTQRAAGVGLSLNGNTIDANVNATVQTVAKVIPQSTAQRTYEIQVDSSDQLVVNVPWQLNTDTGINGVTLATGTGATVPLAESITGRELTLTSNIYSGLTTVGAVPSGGSATTFLRGDGTWVTPTDTVGAVTSVTAATNADLDGMSVTPNSGAVIVGLDIDSLTVENAPLADESYVVVRTDDAGNVKTLIEDFLELHTFKSGTISAYGAITHSLGTFDVMVQIYDETTKDTIHMEVERNTVNQVTIGGTGTFPSGGVIVLVSRMG